MLVFWNWIACKLIAVFVIFFHVVIRTCMCFFFEIPSFEELQDPSNSPRREEVGRRTLRDYGGFLLSFFYRARFQLFALLFSSASKTTTHKPPNTLGTLESTSPRNALPDWWGDFSRGRFLKKQHVCEQVVNCEYNSTMTTSLSDHMFFFQNSSSGGITSSIV